MFNKAVGLGWPVVVANTTGCSGIQVFTSSPFLHEQLQLSMAAIQQNLLSKLFIAFSFPSLLPFSCLPASRNYCVDSWFLFGNTCGRLPGLMTALSTSATSAKQQFDGWQDLVLLHAHHVFNPKSNNSIWCWAGSWRLTHWHWLGSLATTGIAISLSHMSVAVSESQLRLIFKAAGCRLPFDSWSCTAAQPVCDTTTVVQRFGL